MYVHVPFCRRICPYCDFAVLRDAPALHAAWLQALEREIAWAPLLSEPADTLYFGGGTPTALSASELEQALELVHTRADLRSDAVLHLEANPEDVSRERLAEWKALGVRFLSLGIQSFDPEELKRLGRRHDAAQAERALGCALDAGFATVSTDLIFGLPGQSAVTLESNLAVIARLQPQHVSTYQLTIHEGTPFERLRGEGRLVEMSEDEQAERFEQLTGRLEELGLKAYEVSNHARDAASRSQHNAKYWERVPYLGFGPGAHGFDGERRSWNHRSYARWVQVLEGGGSPRAGEERLSPRESLTEDLMLRLRRPIATDLQAVVRRHGFALPEGLERQLSVYEERGWITRQGWNLCPTRRGLGVADALTGGLDALFG